MSTPERYQFRKSTYSDNNASACVEVAGTLDAMRDSKNAAGPVLRFDLAVFLAEIRSGRFTL